MDFIHANTFNFNFRDLLLNASIGKPCSANVGTRIVHAGISDL